MLSNNTTFKYKHVRLVFLNLKIELLKEYEIQIFFFLFHRRDPTGKDVITFIRPMNCAGMCCGIFYPHCTQALTVSINGESAGMSMYRGNHNNFKRNFDY